MKHTFISYVREGAKRVEHFQSALANEGIRAWIDRADLQPGQRWQNAIRAAIQDGLFFIAGGKGGPPVCFYESVL